MIEFDPENYGPAFAPLLAVDRRRPLGAGAPTVAARSSLERLSMKTAFANETVADRDMANCAISAVWLLHDFLDESHTISQSIETPSGSFWHAIMHRREGDFSNAKYWLRRVGQHPIFAALGERADGDWDPFAFVDRCQAAQRGAGADRELCLDLQQAEWELLFDHCYRAAIGA
jgi:hypothetical protein